MYSEFAKNLRGMTVPAMLSALVVMAFIPAGVAWEPMLVYPRILEERSQEARMVMHLHDNLTLYLRKASVAARQLRVLEHDGEKVVTHFYEGQDIEQHLLEDENHWATVHVTRKERGMEVEGVVGPNLRIHPMPEMERSNDGFTAHMIFEVEENGLFDTVMLPKEIGSLKATERSEGLQTGIPDVVQIEVNMRYNETRDPKIKLLFTGVERSPFDQYISVSGNYMHDTTALENFRQQAVYYRHTYGNPDVVYLVTGRELYSTGADGKANTNNLGIGYQAGLCTDYYVGLGEDAPGFYTGIYTMSHEIAHVLGSAHDQSPPLPSMPGHPGSLSCLWESGFIMSYIDNGPNRHRFSPCSLAQMQFVVVMRGKACWDVTHEGKKEDGRYPGTEVSPDDYCKQVVPNQSNVTADLKSPTLQQCKLKCQYPVYQPYYYNGVLYHYSVYYYQLHNALDYMYCGEGKVCIRGICQNRPVDGSVATRPHKPSTQRPTTTTAATTEKCHCDCPKAPVVKNPAWMGFQGLYK
ncbi:venom metalloproteinase antarease-like TtrivMP_A isoform X2 [Amblyomma americanum]